jgi:hypothetical protein
MSASDLPDPPTHRRVPCRCTPPWADLITHIEGQDLPVCPADTPGPTAALYRARCRTCRAEYPRPWRLTHNAATTTRPTWRPGLH